jgi:hypothetical protein
MRAKGKRGGEYGERICWCVRTSLEQRDKERDCANGASERRKLPHSLIGKVSSKRRVKDVDSAEDAYTCPTRIR